MTNNGQRAALICGSVAYDAIMEFPDRFAHHILPEQIDRLNVSFLVPQLRREFGGCAGNIAYNLRLLGNLGYPLATVGLDFGPYRDWLSQAGVPLDYIKVCESAHTAQAFITTDSDSNQIAAFHPGAMQQSHSNPVRATADIGIGIISPDGRDGMLQHAAQFAAARIPFIFDPGQALPLFSAAELHQFIDQASWVAANEYEWMLMQKKSGLSVREVVRKVDALIVTRGAEGSVIHTAAQDFQIPPVKVQRAVDPTGCGDAYRAGLLHGLLHKLDWQTTGRVASLLGAIKVQSRGTQNHRFTVEELGQRYRAAFGTSLAVRTT